MKRLTLTEFIASVSTHVLMVMLFDFDFSLGENTEVYCSCGLTWRGGLFIFSGLSNRNQLSKVEDCQLKHIGQLAFSHYY